MVLIIGIVLGIIIGTSFVFDLFYYRIPNYIIAAGFLIWFPYTLLCKGYIGILYSFCGIAAVGSALFAIYLAGGIGAGDVKLLCMIVSFLSLNDGIRLIILIFFIAGFFGVIKITMTAVYRLSGSGHAATVNSIRFTGPVLLGYLFMLLSKGGI